MRSYNQSTLVPRLGRTPFICHPPYRHDPARRADHSGRHVGRVRCDPRSDGLMSAMIDRFRRTDSLGRERWTEQPIDTLVTRRDTYGPTVEDDLEELRRRR